MKKQYAATVEGPLDVGAYLEAGPFIIHKALTEEPSHYWTVTIKEHGIALGHFHSMWLAAESTRFILVDLEVHGKALNWSAPLDDLHQATKEIALYTSLANLFDMHNGPNHYRR